MIAFAGRGEEMVTCDGKFLWGRGKATAVCTSDMQACKGKA